jgi:hypothetical protein
MLCYKHVMLIEKENASMIERRKKNRRASERPARSAFLSKSCQLSVLTGCESRKSRSRARAAGLQRSRVRLCRAQCRHRQHACGRRILVLDPGRHWLQPRHRRQDCQAAGEASGLRDPATDGSLAGPTPRTAKKQKGIADCPAIPFTSKVSHLSRNCHSLL